MKPIFADSSALVALKDAGDRHHKAALNCLDRLLQGPPVQLVLTNFILGEVHAYFCRAPEVALAYVDHLLEGPLFRLVRISERDERNALEILRGSRDKTYSWVDSTSFALMESLGIRCVFAFDRHFRQRGRQQVIP